MHAVGTVIRRISPSRSKNQSLSLDAKSSSKDAGDAADGAVSSAPPSSQAAQFVYSAKDIGDDRISISSTGTSSTIGYR